MSKSSVLKLYDEAEVEKLKISNTTSSQKINHPVNLDFKAPNSFSQEDGVLDFVNSVRGEDGTHTFSTGLLDGSLTDTEGLIADEGIAYLAHKAAIESALSTEEARSIAATDALALNLNNATIARINQAADLTSDKLNMISGRQQAVIGYNTHVQTGIDEINTQKNTGDSAVTARLDTLMSVGEVDATKLMDVVTAYQAADTTQLSDIATLQSDFTALKTRIDDTIALEAAASSGSSEYYVKITGLWYGGYSTRVKIVLNLEDGTPFYDDIQAGDVYEIQATGHTETVTVTSTDEYVAGVQFALNFDGALTNTYNTEYVTFVKQ